MTMRGLAILASAVVAAGIIGLAYLLGAHSTQPRSANASAIGVARGAAPPAGSAAAAPLRDPVPAATAWLRAYRGISWTDPAPDSWVERVRPYVGADLAAQYDQARQGNAGTSWASFVHDHCTSTVRDIGGVIPPEAPHAPDSVYVQVSGTVITECAAGTPSTPTEPVAATVEVRRIPDGHWVVNRRLF